MNYEAVMDAFGKILVGTMAQSSNVNFSIVWNPTIGVTDATSIMLTSLAYTDELIGWYIEQNTASVNYTEYAILEADNKRVNLTALYEYGVHQIGTLLNATEQLFQNITIGMLSNPQFTSPIGQETNITMYSPQNVYVYSRYRLVAAYVAAIGVTLLSIVLGCRAIVQNGVSYTNNFSSIISATRGNNIDAVVARSTRGASAADSPPEDIVKPA